jgi:hypothetical protein
VLAQDLVQRLRAEYGQGGFLHFGQGKWYPGEQLPRWALSIYWRADGQPCWTDPSLFADEREAHAYTAADAERFMHALSTRLGLPTQFIQTGYEDTWYYLWRERRLPVNVDPFESRLEDEIAKMQASMDMALNVTQSAARQGLEMDERVSRARKKSRELEMEVFGMGMEDVERLRKIFSGIDKDGSGALDPDDDAMRAVTSHVRPPPSEPERLRPVPPRPWPGRRPRSRRVRRTTPRRARCEPC